MAEKYEPKATARHKQMAKSKEQEVEAKKNRYEHEKVALRKYRDERKQALKAVPKEDRPAEKEKTQAEVEKRKALIAKYRDEYKSSSKALKEEKKAKKKAEQERLRAVVTDYRANFKQLLDAQLAALTEGEALLK